MDHFSFATASRRAGSSARVPNAELGEWEADKRAVTGGDPRLGAPALLGDEPPWIIAFGSRAGGHSSTTYHDLWQQRSRVHSEAGDTTLVMMERAVKLNRSLRGYTA